MTFTQIPQQFDPLGEALHYTVTADSAATILLQILDAEGTLLGAKRFVNVTSAMFDIAPCVRRAVGFAPIVGTTGLYAPAGRSIQVSVTATAALSYGTVRTASAPMLTFLPMRGAATLPALLTTMPSVRLIARGEWDELTLLSAQAGTLTVSAQRGGVATVKSYTVKSGECVFKLDTADFPDAEILTVEAGACGTVSYTLIPPVEGGCRLAWRSSVGSMEYYTFPVEKEVEIKVDKELAYGEAGYAAVRTQVERKRSLVSAYETRTVLDAIAEIAASPEVWCIEEGEAVAVDVLTESCIVHRRGTAGCLELEIRPKSKIRMPWN